MTFNAEDSGRFALTMRRRVAWRSSAAITELQRALAAATEAWRAGDVVEEPGRGARPGERFSRRGDVVPPVCGRRGAAGGAMDMWGYKYIPRV